MSRLIANPSDAPQRVAATEAQKKRKRGGNRGRKSVTRDIQAKAHKRQEAWRAGGQPNATYRLTRELNGPEDRSAPEGLYAEHRQVAAGKLPIDDFSGQTMAAGRGT